MDAPPSPEPHRRRRRVGSDVAAIILVTVLVVVWWFGSGNAPGGPEGNGDRLSSPAVEATRDPDAPSTDAVAPARTSVTGVALDGFVRGEGTGLTLLYRAAAARCVGPLETPRILETDAAVTVTLQLVPVDDPPRGCPGDPGEQEVRVDLSSPLSGRSVLDGSYLLQRRVPERE